MPIRALGSMGAALLLVPALACAGLPREFPERAEDDEVVADVELITTELDPATLERLTLDLVTRVDAEGYAIALRYDPRAGAEQIELLPECQVPVHYSWILMFSHDVVYDDDEDIFVTPHPGRANTWVRLARGAHAQSRVERVARIDDHPHRPFDHRGCVGATHVLSEFQLGTRTATARGEAGEAGEAGETGETGQPESLLAVRLEPLATPQQERWLARRDRRRLAGDVALSALGTLALVGLAVVCLADVDNCDDDDDDDGLRADDADASQRSAPQRPMTPMPGVELGRGKRAKLEAGGGGLRLRF